MGAFESRLGVLEFPPEEFARDKRKKRKRRTMNLSNYEVLVWGRGIRRENNEERKNVNN